MAGMHIRRSLAALILAGSAAVALRPLSAEELAAPLLDGSYEESITNEALTGYPDGREAPAVLRSGIVTGTISGMKSQAESGAEPELPTAESLLPTLPLTLADGRVVARVAPATSSLSFSGDDQRVNLDLGLGYYQPERGAEQVGGTAGLATMLGRQIALGTTARVYDQRRDVALNGIWQHPTSGIRLQLSGGYMWGDELFDFPSGEQTIGVDQYSWLFSTSWIVPSDDSCSSLHSVGATAWGSAANQATHPDPVFFTEELATEYLIYRDPIQLSEGRLFGFSADTQVALFPNLVTRLSLGIEELIFPFADGTREKTHSLYSDVAFSWEPISRLTFETGWSRGESATRYSASARSGQISFSGWYSDGRNGIADTKGATLTYSIDFSDPSARRAQASRTLARRMQPSRTTSSSALLQAAMRRPEQFPESFLAKVDLTAVTLEASISKSGMDDDVEVSSLSDTGDVTIPFPAAPTITSVLREGTAYAAYAGFVEPVGEDIVLHVGSMPEGAATWEICVSAGDSYVITIEVQ